MANLVDEPYCLTMEEVAKLTMRQVVLIYFRDRDRKTGAPKRVDPTWVTEEEIDELEEAKKQFFAIGSFMGRSYEDLNAEWERMNDGDSSGKS